MLVLGEVQSFMRKCKAVCIHKQQTNRKKNHMDFTSAFGILADILAVKPRKRLVMCQ